MKTTAKYLSFLAGAVLFFVILNPLYIINEGEQAVVTRFGEIVADTPNAGLHVRIPFIDIVHVYPKMIMSLEGDSQRIPTRENQFIIVDTTSRWKIIDPVKFYEAVTDVNTAYSRLSDIVDSSVRTVITSSKLNEVVRNSNLINELQHRENFALGADAQEIEFDEITTDKIVYERISRGRRALSDEMADIAREKVLAFGIDLIDIVPRQIKYSDELTESVYNRMIKERNQIAQTFRSAGEGKKAEWMGKLETKRAFSEAYNRAEEIKARQMRKLPVYMLSPIQKIRQFWKSIESYRKTVPQFEKVLSTDMDYFRYLYTPAGR